MDHRTTIFVGSLLVAFLVCSEAASVKMTNAVCKTYNKSWVDIHYCRLKAYSRNKTSLHINATFLEPANNIFIHSKMMKKANGYKPFLFDYTFDACEFMRRRNQPFAKMIWNLIRNVSTVNHTCPYVGLQVVSDFYRIEFPVSFPTGGYLLLIDWIFDGKSQYATNVYFTFVEDLFTRRSF
ncbi:uncharacterized protein LOC108028921 [Drosophila biarmipes]|uniref:uncharacterized protein LOC108028921 n=1 Tax=Drosophila biarmipes TaxID=125945 RepID=UPI0007E6ABC8|nr:uncharacterized protein LOC108028921 [Drosophila biarmipes]